MIRLSRKEVTLTIAKSSENPFPDVLRSAHAPASWWVILIVMWQFKGWIHIKSVLTKFASTVMFYDRFVKRKITRDMWKRIKRFGFMCVLRWMTQQSFQGGESIGFLMESRQFGVIFLTATKECRLPHNKGGTLSRLRAINCLIQEAKHISSG